jgi:RNA polymerase sigma-70 factor (ECF subfamily)
MSAKEVATVVDAPVLTVRTRLFYARKELYAAIAHDPHLESVVADLVNALPGRPQPNEANAAAREPPSARTKGTTKERKRSDTGGRESRP